MQNNLNIQLIISPEEANTVAQSGENLRKARKRLRSSIHKENGWYGLGMRGDLRFFCISGIFSATGGLQ